MDLEGLQRVMVVVCSAGGMTITSEINEYRHH